MKKNTIDIITMGCSKNLVESERLMGMFERKGYHCVHDPKHPQGEIAVINTCGFIGDAKEESINTILEFAQAKEEGRLRKLFVMGCLSERYQKELEEEIPQVDKYYGKFNYKQLLEDLGEAKGMVTSNPHDGVVSTEPIDGVVSTHPTKDAPKQGDLDDVPSKYPTDDVAKRDTTPRHITTPRHYAYLKISEGCDRHCAYCAIPIITGKHVSRPMDEILDEVRQLVADGTKEFQVIAQELTYYGIDIDGKQHIAELIDQMAKIKGVKWIRLHYAYPTHFPWDLLRVIRENENVCNYLDIALQHISDNMLSRMHRHVTKAETYELIERMRREVPGIHIRTTLMVGFPGETDEDFRELMDFTRWARFERMGAFAYSEEEGTYSANHYPDDVPPEVKQARLDKLMALQQRISTEIEAEKVGKTLRVIIDRKEGAYYIGRTEFCSPEVDPEVLIPAAERELRTGRFYNVEITDSEEFDLYGRVV